MGYMDKKETQVKYQYLSEYDYSILRMNRKIKRSDKNG